MKNIPFTLLMILSCLSLCVTAEDRLAEIEAGVPWTYKPFRNDADDFQFVVIGDRTGGHRPGIFADAMAKINLLQPEFVVSVGDLIEGYTEDSQTLEQQWDELDSMVDSLDMPFFYTVGNHDISNNVMRDLWRQRLGKDYYAFIYKNVLFLSLNTEDPPITLPPEAVAGQLKLEAMMQEDPERTQARLLARSREQGNPPSLPGTAHISDAQVAFVEKTLAENRDVRWTILLMHKPAWEYGNEAFFRIESMLADRDYTVIAGHEHYYLYNRRHGRDYVDMATTGGIWLRDGVGRVDHIAWVTMGDEGPRFANIRLDGIFDKTGPGGESSEGRQTGDAPPAAP